MLRFLEAQQQAPAPAAELPRSPRERDAASEAAARELEASGC